MRPPSSTTNWQYSLRTQRLDKQDNSSTRSFGFRLKSENKTCFSFIQVQAKVLTRKVLMRKVLTRKVLLLENLKTPFYI